MISREEAGALILKHAKLLSSEDIGVDGAVNRVLAAEVRSPIDHPIFDQSAMDGYCFSHSSMSQTSVLKLRGEIQAGGDSDIKIGPGECARIFTGAKLPASCDTVIMQEQTAVDGDQITLTNTELKAGANVRVAGEQLQKGEVALATGSILNSAAIGFLASLGIDTVRVARYPKVHIVCTGNEFAENKDDLGRGKIFESNGHMLVACLSKLGIKAEYEICTDHLKVLTELIALRENQFDLLLITGGVSVGDYDFTVPALEANGFETIFHKISQKPGKPLLFTTKERCTAFGLPGNPRAVLICFFEYVRAYIMQAMGSDNPILSQLWLPLAVSFNKKDDKRTHFLAAAVQDGKAILLNVQGSHMLSSMTAAEGLVVLPPEARVYEAGDMVEFHLIQ
jgi:molybdopterin molybdotransferase